MPVRSLNSSVLRWPDRDQVRRAAREWAIRVAAARPEVCRIGYFGSYARGDWGVGSDLDLVVLVDATAEPFELRPLDYDTSALPVPADLLVYTIREWATKDQRRWPAEERLAPVVWVSRRED
jgi:uncharacterized protein